MHRLCFNKIHFHSPTYTPLFSPKSMHSYFSNLLCPFCALCMYMGVRPSARGWVASQGCIHEEIWLSLLEDLSVTEGSSGNWGFLSHLPSVPGFIPTWACNGLCMPFQFMPCLTNAISLQMSAATGYYHLSTSSSRRTLGPWREECDMMFYRQLYPGMHNF